MNKKIKQLVEGLGIGLCGAVAYDTAVVAYIPSFEDSTKPQFPEALEWITNNQLPNGSWGTSRPLYAHGNTLSTLAAIIALKKWDNNSKYISLISRGVEALIELAEKLPLENHESIGYEILIPSLLRKAKECGLKIPFNKYINSEISEAKLDLIKSFHKKYGFKKKHTFWFSLEMIDGLDLTPKNYFKLEEHMLDENGSVLASPSATAYYLNTIRSQNGIDVPKAYTYIKNLIHLHKGGIPAISPSDTFELSFSLAALLMAGIEPSDEILRPAIDRLYDKWQEFNGYIGCSSYLPPDSDAIAMTIYVLYSSKRLTENNSVNPLLTFFNGLYLECFKGERNHSISVNINGLIALKLFDTSPKIEDIISKIVVWLESKSTTDEFIFEDKWHFSPYYCISRAVFAFHKINHKFSQRCVDQLLSHQKSDGGWGLGQESTLEETALVTLALCYWFRNNDFQINKNNMKIVQSIDHFFKTFSGERYVELWIAKSLYCPITVVEAFIIAANYSLKNTILLFKSYGKCFYEE